MTTLSPAYPLVPNGWEATYDKRFNLAIHALRHDDTQLVAAMRAHDCLAVDQPWTNAYDKKFADLEAFYAQSTDRLKLTLENIKGNADGVKSKMSVYARSSGANQEGWVSLVDKSCADLKAKDHAELEDLRTFGKQRIQTLPPEQQNIAAEKFLGGLSAVGHVFGAVVGWLKEAASSAWEFLEHAVEKIKSFAIKVKDSVVSGMKTVVAWFKGVFSVDAYQLSQIWDVRSSTGGGKGLSHLPDIGYIASRLQNVGLDTFSLVREDAGWVIQLQ